VAEAGLAACGSAGSAGGRAARGALGAGILAAIPLAACQLLWLMQGLDAGAWPLAVVGFGVGALVADAITGGVHWACDTWGSPRTRWLGPALIASFREHHRDPRAICRHDWVEVNREAALAAALGFALLGLPAAREWSAERPMAHALLWSLLAFGGAANQIHRWAHARRVPRPVRWLQRSGLLLSAERHARHHRAPHTRSYCIATGWLNAPLDSIGFWRVLERAIRCALPRRNGNEARGMDRQERHRRPAGPGLVRGAPQR
jgi:ubiquitin-conjugating enzyme E2 variant